jgi:hypothetical protein
VAAANGTRGSFYAVRRRTLASRINLLLPGFVPSFGPTFFDQMCFDHRRLVAPQRPSGNDLSTPVPEFGFRGLKPGDRWCLCAPRWQEALEAGQAPRVVLRASHEGALDHCSLADLKRFAVDLA